MARGPIIPKADQTAPVAAAIIIDCGPSMAYRSENKTRLEAAKEMSDWILGQLPLDSRVGILSGVPVGALSLDPASAKAQVQVLSQRGAHLDLPGQIETALRLLTASDLERKEIYVITDLSSSSWSTPSTGLKEQLAQRAGDILVQVIDLGNESISNWRLGDIAIDAQLVSEGASVSFDIELTRSDAATPGNATIELLQEAIDPKLPILRNGKLELPSATSVGKRTVDLSKEHSARVTLNSRPLEAGTNNFQIRVDKPDPLELDNVRYASVVTQSPQPVLIVADDPSEADLYMAVVDPRDATERGSGPRLSEQIRFSQIMQAKLDQYAAVCLINPPALGLAAVARLKERVEKGGGLLIVLGGQLNALENIESSPLSDLLPGQLKEVIERPREDRNLFLVRAAVAHPLFAPFSELTDEVPWYRHPVFKYWEFASLKPTAQILMTYSARSAPAVIIEPREKGQILTLTTLLPESDSLERLIWNELTLGDYWPAANLLDGAMQVLTGSPQSKFTYFVGETASLENNPQLWSSRYELFTPLAQAQRIEAADGLVMVGQLDQAGTYRLRGQRAGEVRGVSANVRSSDTALARLPANELDGLLGEGTYRLARDRSEVTSSVGQARFGQELYAWLMVLIAGLFLAEQAMSNRFYKLKLASVGAGP